MNDDLTTGTKVRTSKPAKLSTDWGERAVLERARHWGKEGTVIERSDSHGVIYRIDFSSDASRTAWFERRELQRLMVDQYSPVERRELLAKMSAASDAFYGTAASIGVHAFIEFAGLMNEFIKICQQSEEKGVDFTMCNTHTGRPLIIEHWHAAYLAEKLDCIYGPSLSENPAARRAFVSSMFPECEDVLDLVLTADGERVLASVFDRIRKAADGWRITGEVAKAEVLLRFAEVFLDMKHHPLARQPQTDSPNTT